MKLSIAATTALASVAAAAPSSLESRQAGGGTCFVFARGSTEPSPIGIIIGPALQRALLSKIPGMKTIPVAYAASIMTNISIQRTDAASIQKGHDAFKQAAGCGIIIAGGYSQGAAVMHNVVPKLDAAIKSKLVGVALFGDTRNKQDSGHIPGFPTGKSKVWCNPSDGVCGGGLNVNGGHLSYSSASINEAATWLANLVKGGVGAGGEEGAAPAAAPKMPKMPKMPKSTAPAAEAAA
ncbi:alpha/beta-hydrolase [Microthyrium microscopicum]|uniref:cutinase n=1 Tax=Microthyrium microscopicum TaxID=703497 RepID=A0A6A6U1U9_9PEZI|nr:alpha/beta-hydrolase [Microthyrium microscopicum]